MFNLTMSYVLPYFAHLCTLLHFYAIFTTSLPSRLADSFVIFFNLHPKLNISPRLIANKYHEGKMKRTLKRELKVPEIAERKADGTSVAW